MESGNGWRKTPGTRSPKATEEHRREKIGQKEDSQEEGCEEDHAEKDHREKDDSKEEGWHWWWERSDQRCKGKEALARSELRQEFRKQPVLPLGDGAQVEDHTVVFNPGHHRRIKVS